MKRAIVFVVMLIACKINEWNAPTRQVRDMRRGYTRHMLEGIASDTP